MRTSKCKSCGADIIWVKTIPGERTMPLDAKSYTLFVLEPEGAQGGSPRCKAVQVRASHFSTCADADAWRKAKEQG